jgi:regulator of RNase E activity RraA
MSRQISPETFTALAALDTCVITNAIECFDVRLRNEGFTDASIVCRTPALPPMLGYALTLRVRSSSPSWKGVNYLDRTDWWPHLEVQPAPRVLVIQDMDRRPGTGAFVGEIHAAILQALGAIGAVTNGAVRDLPAVERLGFRLFSSSVAVSHAYAHIVEIGGAAEIGGLRINNGDLLHGDQHGIVQIPFEVADKIPPTAAGIRQRERRILKYCHSPNFTMEGLKELSSGDPCPPEAPSCGTRKDDSSH